MTTPDLTTTSGPGRWFTPRHIVGIVLGSVLALITGSVLWWVFSGIGATTIDATFKRSVGIYSGTDVKLLGVPVGKVTKVTPDGDKVQVRMRVQRGLKLPADVRAVQVAPSIIADRYVQLTPAYNGGPRAPRDISLSIDQTMVPVEVDELYANLQKLSRSLGPDGVNAKKGEKEGVVTEFVRVGADNFRGNGEKLGSAFTNLSKAATTLSDSSGNIVDTIKQLNTFVAALAENDAQVRQFNSQMASFNTFLAGERKQLGQALATLSVALGDVARFVNDNQELLGDTVRSLQPTAKTLRDNQESLKEIFTVLPVTVSNLINAYDAESGTLAMRLTIQDLQNLLAVQCKLLNPGSIMPGTQPFLEWQHKMAPIISHCTDIAKQIQAGVSPLLPVLPFGIMSNDKTQRYSVPGTRRGRPDPGLMIPMPTDPNPQTPRRPKPRPSKPKPSQTPERGGR
ncbi:Mce family protein [Gordonia araii NBRC 100433]|uniref:Mce family protein n=1 Tax=Gordonia araii NBRC 100433 TaxID=1073574 RepID=G7H7H6_9ACTN|nr:MCE family protein [Gordonia araii]NNG98484.1 MCE family protein [Gordonia araii NBRC 100433]GAB11801.1 Mce family protein [Gordonia araii NBRC 100433]